MIDRNDLERFLKETIEAGRLMAGYALDGFERIREMSDDPWITAQASESAESVNEQLEVIDTFAETLVVELLTAEALRRQKSDDA